MTIIGARRAIRKIDPPDDDGCLPGAFCSWSGSERWLQITMIENGLSARFTDGINFMGEIYSVSQERAILVL